MRQATALRLVESFAPSEILGEGGRLLTNEFVGAVNAVEAMAKSESLGVLTGETGAGKTSVCAAYEQHNRRVLLVTAPCRMEYRESQFMRSIAAKLGVGGNSIWEVGQAVREAISHQQRVVIVDEATHLPVAAMDWLRRVNDDTQQPIIFVGLPSLWTKIRQHGGEIAGRVGIKHTMKSLTSEECRKVCSHLSEEVFDEVFRRTQGRMRDLLQALDLLNDLHKANAARWASIADVPVGRIQKFLGDHFLGSEA